MAEPTHCAQASDNSLPLDRATALIAEAISPLTESISLPLGEALNRVLAENIVAPVAVPQHRNSAMDGFAFRHADGNPDSATALRVVGQSLAGHPYQQPVGPGEAIAIMTGAVVPDALDTIVVQEVVERDQDTIRFDTKSIRKGAFVRGIGDDIQAGTRLLNRGTRLGPAQLGVLASVGIGHIETIVKPRVSVMSTGDELQPAGTPLSAGQIYDSNRVTLQALIAQSHANAIDIGQVADSESAIRHALDAAAEKSDVILSSGGVSVGVADHMRAVLQSEGTLDFWKIAVKPGRPLVFGRWKNAWYFGLPGNPVSAMVTFDQIVRPALALLSGEQLRTPVALTVTCTSTLTKMPGRMEFQRGTFGNAADGSLTVQSTGNQDSHVLTSLHNADCLIVLPLESSGANPGETVNVIPLHANWSVAATPST